MVTLLVGMVLIMSTMVNTGLRSAGTQMTADSSRQSALYALDLALGELQVAAGPDQRVTATADILSEGTTTTPATGHAKWAGVWDTAGYDPLAPTTKKFVAWLVSGKNVAGQFALPSGTTNSTLSAAKAAASDEVTLFNGKNADGTPNATSTVKVPKVLIDRDAITGAERHFAFWVEDEGVKADLRWNEGGFTTAAAKQQSRLASSPGPDFGQFGAPFTPTYPLDTTTNGWLATAAKAGDAADLNPLLSATSTWLQANRHDMTIGSQGVLADVKRGGLRRDLSLAFEMDGTADTTPAMTRFNNQTKEFTGTGDLTTDPLSAADPTYKVDNIIQRHLYSYVPRAGHRVRGPTWHVLRDYYNLYKRTQTSGSGYTMTARSINDVTPAPLGAGCADLHGINTGMVETQETLKAAPSNPLTLGAYRYMPLRGNYSPVLLSTRFILSAVAVDKGVAPNTANQATLALGLEPIFYLWNPYNVTLKMDNVSVRLSDGNSAPFMLTITVVDGGTSTEHPVIPNMAWLFSSNGGNGRTVYSLTDNGSSLTIAPGEVVVFSPTATVSATSFQSPTGNIIPASPGYNISSNGGIVFRKIKITGGSNFGTATTNALPITVSNATTIKIQVDLSTTAAVLPYTYLNFTPANITSPTTTNAYPIQQTYLNLMAAKDGEAPSPGTISGILATDIDNRKEYLAQMTYNLKPTSAVVYTKSTGGTATSPPVELFARTNPLAVSARNTPWRFSPFDHFLSMSTGTSINTLLNAGGQSVTALNAGRNGFYGKDYDTSGKSFIPMVSIPTGPILSLAAFRHAALSLNATDPLHQVGNSLSNPYIPGTDLAGLVDDGQFKTRKDDLTDSIAWTYDSSWLINDALWDRYFLSGIAPPFSTDASGYSATATTASTLTQFFSATPAAANANPALRPINSTSKTISSIISDLSGNNGYKHMAAYSMINGAFNINSTSIPAWTALLSANRDLKVAYTEPSTSATATDSTTGTPFPKTAQPSGPSTDAWTGFRRLTTPEITGLATAIVAQIKLRGPFQSISDFINRRLSTDAYGYWGAVQAAIQATGINSGISGIDDQGTTPSYTLTGESVTCFLNESPGTGSTATGINGSIMQADIIEPISSRLSARSDTFKIRAYGETRGRDGKRTSKACIEAVVQRVPEYFDPTNNPWDDDTVQSSAALTADNKKFGRRFKIIQQRWLNPDEFAPNS